MDNASKALLIAGAVLLVIAIIAVAMGIFGTARGVVDNSKGQIDNMSIQMHNKQFEQYEGIGKSLPQVKELVSVIISNNAQITDGRFRVAIRVAWYNYVGNNGTMTYSYESTDYYDLTTNNYVINHITSGIDYKGDIDAGHLEKYDVKYEYSSEGIINRICIAKYKK